MVELKSLKDWDAKVGDTFVYHMGNSQKPTGKPMTIVKVNGQSYYAKLLDDETVSSLSNRPYWALVIVTGKQKYHQP